LNETTSRRADSRWATSHGWSIIIMRLHRNEDMAPQTLDARTDAQMILYSVQCYALH